MSRVDLNLAEVDGNFSASQSNYLVINSGGNIYAFILEQNSALYWQASYDGGFTWTGKNAIKTGVNLLAFSVWFDQWTPGDSGTIVHLWYFDSTNDDVYYRAFDINAETLGTEVVVFAGTSTGAVANTCISGVKSRGANLYVAFDIDGGTETGFYRSVDAGANWTSRTDVNEASSDYYLLAPGFASDSQDIICIFWDRSASEISRKLYSDSGNSWGESSIATSMTAIATSTSSCQFAISVSDALDKILLVAWSNRNTVNADLRYWYLDESSITEGTNVVLNSGGNQGSCSLCLANNTNTLYVFYFGKSDGSETIGTAINLYYKTSTNNGTTWGSETKMTVFARDYDYLFTVPVIVDITGDFFASFKLDVASFDQLLLSVDLPSGVSGGGGIFGGSVIE